MYVGSLYSICTYWWWRGLFLTSFLGLQGVYMQSDDCAPFTEILDSFVMPWQYCVGSAGVEFHPLWILAVHGFSKTNTDSNQLCHNANLLITNESMYFDGKFLFKNLWRTCHQITQIAELWQIVHILQPHGRRLLCQSGLHYYILDYARIKKACILK